MAFRTVYSPSAARQLEGAPSLLRRTIRVLRIALETDPVVAAQFLRARRTASSPLGYVVLLPYGQGFVEYSVFIRGRLIAIESITSLLGT